MELKPDGLAAEWKAGKFRPVYYLFGEESASKADAVLRLKSAFKADDFNLREFSGTEIGSHLPPPLCIDAHGAPLCVGHGLFRSYMGRLLLGESIPERILSLDNQSRHQSSEVVS